MRIMLPLLLLGTLLAGCDVSPSVKVGQVAPSLPTKTLADVGNDFSQIATYRYPPMSGCTSIRWMRRSIRANRSCSNSPPRGTARFATSSCRSSRDCSPNMNLMLFSCTWINTDPGSVQGVPGHRRSLDVRH